MYNLGDSHLLTQMKQKIKTKIINETYTIFFKWIFLKKLHCAVQIILVNSNRQVQIHFPENPYLKGKKHKLDKRNLEKTNIKLFKGSVDLSSTLSLLQLKVLLSFTRNGTEDGTKEKLNEIMFKILRNILCV
jgi:hypothetical protein